MLRMHCGSGKSPPGKSNGETGGVQVQARVQVGNRKPEAWPGGGFNSLARVCLALRPQLCEGHHGSLLQDGRGGER